MLWYLRRGLLLLLLLLLLPKLLQQALLVLRLLHLRLPLERLHQLVGRLLLLLLLLLPLHVLQQLLLLLKGVHLPCVMGKGGGSNQAEAGKRSCTRLTLRQDKHSLHHSHGHWH